MSSFFYTYVMSGRKFVATESFGFIPKHTKFNKGVTTHTRIWGLAVNIGICEWFDDSFGK